jgi:sterol desaturase/sphingolipid hydroxylase (fatty acid hydroxylase superfamily)
VIIYGPLVAVMLWLAVDRDGVLDALVLVLAGYVLWTLFEYWLHRLVFHFEPEDGVGARLHWIIHGVHHDHPNDPMRLVMPPSVSVPLSVLFFILFVAVLGTPTAYAVGAGFWTGYLVYDEIHYHLHHHMPKTRAGKLLRELHMRHHFQDDTRGFGISAPYWDTVFRTPLRRGSKKS